MAITLREIRDEDFDALFEWERNPAAVALASFTRSDPSDRDLFDAHYARIRNDPSVRVLAVDDDHGLVGSVGSFTIEGDREVTYWIDPGRWGEGLATAALGALLLIEPTRPLFARVAEHNVGSVTVLERSGFVRIGSETSFAPGLGHDVVEHIFRLER